MKKKSYITVTDQFCGAGGSSIGARKVLAPLGGHVAIAMNHWKLAIETHNTNFPETDHDCTDISACDPRRYQSTDILITSPECTNHSLAKGKKIIKAQLDLFDQCRVDPAAERSRATMWDVPRFAEYHNYNIIIVENVVDARKWVQFPAWLHAMHLLGYLHKAVYLNSMHCHPTPQSRDRMYVVFWKKGNKAPNLDIKPIAYCPKCNANIESFQAWKSSDKKFGKYKQQYLYRCPVHGDIVEPYYHAAFNVIDWSDVGKRIGDRPKPLSENTERRIRYGLKKYGKEPFQIINYSPGTSKPIKDGYVRSVGESSLTQTVRQSMSLVVPLIINNQQQTGVGFRVKSAADVVQTQSTQASFGIAMPPPFMVVSKQTSNAKPITDPASTLTTIGHLGVVTNEAWNSFIHSHYGQTTLSGIIDPIGTQTTRDRHSIVNFQEPKYEDCFYRMLKPHEIQAAMAFDRDYIVLGSGKDKVKQLGNAVTPPAMEMLVQRCVESLN